VVPRGQRGAGSCRDDRGYGLRHDLLRLHGQRRGLQRLCDGRDGQHQPRPGGERAGRAAASIYAHHLRGLRRSDQSGGVAEVFQHLRLRRDRRRRDRTAAGEGLALIEAPEGQLFQKSALRSQTRSHGGKSGALSLLRRLLRLFSRGAGVLPVSHHIHAELS